MARNSFETLFGENLLEDAGITPSTSTKRKPKLVPLRPPASETEPTKEGTASHIPVGQIVVNKQHREVFEDIPELAASIQAHGLIQPILVRYRPDQTFELVAGERRLRAVKHLKLDMVPCIIRQLDDAQVSALQLAENLNRKSLNPIEEAKAFRDVIAENSWTLDAAAKKYGRNKSTVSRSLQLLELPEELQKQIINGDLSPRRALSVAQLADDKSQRALLKQAREKSLTVEQTEQLVKSRLGGKHRSQRRQAEKVLSFPVEGGRTWRVSVNSKTTYAELEQDAKELLEEIQTRRKARVSVH